MNADTVDVIIGLGTLVFLCVAAARIIANTERKSQPNYKNISLMARNLSECKVSTRQTVLTELSEDPEWSSEEVEELRTVLEGMLNTRITIQKSGEKPKLTARSIND